MNGKRIHEVSRNAGLDTVRTVADLRRVVRGWREQGETVALIPTMGALHAGHLSLVRRGLASASRTCVSLFVNPTQFAPHEDVNVYPRDELGDAAKLEEVGTHLLFAPSCKDMYPEGDTTRVNVGGIANILEGEFRPGFFNGVATVVTKLLLQALPDVAVFGEKDYQQLQVVKRLVCDLHIPVKIACAKTVREPDGLALSSRNAYLSCDERAMASDLYWTLNAVADHVANGEDPEREADRGVETLLAAGFAKVDYLSVRDAVTLEPWSGRGRPGRVLAAAWLGSTRLIDNVPLTSVGS
ncbi:MAG TPA: pantoate--beta-alanine ligase [Rhodospirillales bacterium]|nr:pantoate--beta-alanine ligase [Rhodospirillales bacterium]